MKSSLVSFLGRPWWFTVLALLLGAAPARAVVEFSVLQNINTDSSGAAASSPQCFVALGGKVYFTAIATGSTRRQLFSYDASAAIGSQVTQVSSFTGNTTHPSFVRVMGGKLVMSAQGTASGYQLWEYDPAAAAGSQFTEMVTVSGASSTDAPRNFLVEGGKLYFAATDGARSAGKGFQLYVFDPALPKASLAAASPNPKRLTNLATNSSSGCNPANLVAAGGHVFFSANLGYQSNDGGGIDAVDDTELVMVNTSTQAVTTFQLAQGSVALAFNSIGYTDAFDSSPLGMRAVVANTLYFSANYTQSPHGSANYRGQVLMKFDPTTMSVPVKVAERNTDAGVTTTNSGGGFIISANYPPGDDIQGMTAVGTKVYYAASDGSGQKLYVCDTAASDAVSVVAGVTTPKNFTTFNSRLYCLGDVSGTLKLVEVDPASGVTSFTLSTTSVFALGGYTTVGSNLYFAASGGSSDIYRFDVSARTITKQTGITSTTLTGTTARQQPLGIGTSGGDFLFSGADAIVGSEVFHFAAPVVSAPVISSALTASGTYGAAISTYTITASGTPTSYSATGLPAGLGVNTTNGAITGTPTAAGTFNTTIGATSGTGSDSKTLVFTIAKTTQTVSWDALANKTFGDGAFPVSAVATSLLPVSYSVVSGNATISGDIVTLTGVGTVTLRADQAGDGNYFAATGSNSSFLVSNATATVTLGSLSSTYNGAPHAATATTSPAGLTVTFTYNGSAIAPTSAGSYTVVGTVSDASYAGSATGTLAIAKATLGVTAALKTRAYGAADPAFTATFSGLAGSDTSTVISGAAAFSTDTVATSAVGSHAITPSIGSLSAANYSFTTFNTGTLTITKAPLVVSADAKSRAYGSSEPTFTATLTGFANSETSAVVSGTATFTTDALVTSNVGAFAITPAIGSLAATNYSFTFAVGTLTVNKASLVATASDRTKIYGAANPVFAATISGFKNSDTLTVVSGTAALTTLADVTSVVGTYPIQAAVGSLAASNYSFTFAAGSLAVTKAPLTVTADNLGRGYGGANPLFTAVISGFVNGDTLAATTGAPVLTTPATPASAQGTYPISLAAGTLAAANYDFSFIDGTLTISKSVLTVTADDKSRAYGAGNPALTYAISGYLFGDTAAIVTGTPDLSTTAGTASPVSSYAITTTIGSLIATNYTFAAVNGTLTVAKASLTVTADHQTKVYGAANPAFTATTTGFLNGDTPAGAITGAASLTTPASVTSPVNSYAITVAAGTLSSPNYAFAFAPGTLSVTRAPLTVTTDDRSRAYGASNPAFTASFGGFITGDTAATAVTGAPDYATVAAANSPVASYTVTPSLGSLASANYDFTTFAHGSLAITPASLTVTANSATRSYGGASPALAATLSGFVNGETMGTSGVTGAPALSTSATTSSGVSTYAITAAAGSLSAGNYVFGPFVAGTLTVDKAPLTVTADPKSRVYGAVNPALTATLSGFVNGETLAMSGVTGTAAVSTTATPASPVATYALTPAVGGLTSANYSFIQFLPDALAVTKATLTVTADNLNRGYGSANPTFTAAVSGFVNSDTLAGATTGAPVFTTLATTVSAQGAYPITGVVGTLTAPNYSFALFDGTLTVTKAILTVAADGKSRAYGEANPALTYTITGFLIGDSAALVAGLPTLATTATLASPANPYPITIDVAGLSTTNYAFAATDGVLTVTKATLTLTADDKSKIYGSANPPLSATLHGFLNGDTAAAVTGTAALSTPATAVTGVGNTAITAAVGSLSAANYAFAFVPGTLTVTKAPLTVTADDRARSYGAADPAFTTTLIGFVNGDTAAGAVTGSAAIASAATVISPVNAYALTPSLGTLASVNYEFVNFTPGILTLTRAPLAVTADAKTRFYGAANPAFTATISGFVNGETPATAGVSGTATLTSLAGTGSPAGGYVIIGATGSLTAANYTFTIFTDGVLTVARAPLTVTADPKTRAYGAANPTLTSTLSGFVNGETLATAGVTGSAAFTTTANIASGTGAYAVSPTSGTLGATNYTFTTFVHGSFTIAPAALTITADDKARAYSAPNPVFTATVSGFVNGETLATSGVTGAAALSTAATAASTIGTFPIASAPGTLAAENYRFALFVDGTLAISKAGLTIAADALSKIYGAANPALTATIAGFVGGDTLATAVTGAADLATTATTAAGAGTYPITLGAGTLAAPNYSLSFTPATLTITKATLAVTANSATRIYQAADPVFTATITGFVNGDTAAIGAPAINTTATASSSVGSYAITPGAGSLTADNYAFTFASGTLTVTPASAQVSLGNLSQGYTGAPRTVSVSTAPAGLAYGTSYGGSASAPTNAGSYAVSITISDANHTGGNSGTLVIAKAAQTLSFALPSVSPEVGASITLTASASSGLPVTFSIVSGTASLSGATLIVTDVSSVVVRATQAGNENYLAISTEHSLSSVGKLAQTITFSPLPDKLSTDASFALAATASSGQPVSFTILSGPAMLDGSRVTLTGTPGTAIVRASQAGNATYAAAADVVRSFQVSEDGANVFFGDVGDGSNQKVGDVAATLPARSTKGTLMIIVPSFGVNVVLDFNLEPDGSFVSTVVATAPGSAIATGGLSRAGAARTLTVRGRLLNGVLTGHVDDPNLNFSTTVLPRTGTTAGIAGFYRSDTLNATTGSTTSIVGAQGQMLVIATTPAMTTGAAGRVGSDGTFRVQAPGAVISGAVDAPSTTVTGTISVAGQSPVAFSGLASTTVRTDRLINLSSRVRVGGGDRVLITGFVIGGSQAKQVLVRAVGPGLAGFGVQGALANPRIRIFGTGGQIIAENDDWSTDGNPAAVSATSARVGAFSLTGNSADAALLATLPPGAYTAQVLDGGGTGVVLAEIYDASSNPQTEYQRLVNISTRGEAGTGENILIGGFVVTGNAPKRVLVRGIGPGLAAFGVAGVLADPVLRVYRGTELIGENDNWAPTAGDIGVAEAARATGAFVLSTDSKDAALILTLAPGAYTAQVGAANGSATGVALVEIYELPE